MITLHVFFTLLIFVPIWYLGNQALDRAFERHQAVHALINILFISGFVMGSEFFLGSAS